MVFPAAPYPLRASGLSIRYLPVIEHLSGRYVLDLVIIGEQDVSAASIDSLRAYSRHVTVVEGPSTVIHGPASKALMQARIMLPWTLPNLCTFYEGRRLARQVEALTSGRCYDCLVSVGGLYTPYLSAVARNRTVVDFIDSPSLLVRRGVLRAYGASVPNRYELWKVLRWEASVIRTADASVYVSEVDARVIPESWTPGRTRRVIPNGVSVNGYSPGVDERVTSPSIAFLGNMGYPPNVEAVQWLFEHVFLPVRRSVPELSLYVIGRSPADAVTALGRRPGVTVTGHVDDLWPYVNAVDVFVFPIWRGAGLKNKVLEALYAKRAVITTEIGSEGVGATHGRELIVCSTAEQFQDAVLSLLRCPDERRRLGEAGHRVVRERFSWDLILAQFEAVIAG
jgi:glycosyltransferase involved in cell wall biosynthesis